jgi:cysteine synthase A
MRLFGAQVDIQPLVAFTDPRHYFQHAKQLADANKDTHIFTNQFENLSNFAAHYSGTGPEIWADAPETDAFVCAAGTGGTIAGVSKFLKEKNPAIKVMLIDPWGSSLFRCVVESHAFGCTARLAL